MNTNNSASQRNPLVFLDISIGQEQGEVPNSSFIHWDPILSHKIDGPKSTILKKANLFIKLFNIIIDCMNNHVHTHNTWIYNIAYLYIYWNIAPI